MLKLALHRIKFGLAPPADPEPLDLVPGFVAVSGRDGRLLAIVDSWDRAVEFVHNLRRGPSGRRVRVVTYLAGDGEGQFAVTSRWRVELDSLPREEWWFSMQIEKKKGKNPWKKPDQPQPGEGNGPK